MRTRLSMWATFGLGLAVLGLGLATPVWAADGCACDVQFQGSAVQCNAGSCPPGYGCTQLDTWGPNPGSSTCACVRAGSSITDPDCHTVVLRDGAGGVTGFNCLGVCPAGKNCTLGNSQCPGLGLWSECLCQ